MNRAARVWRDNGKPWLPTAPLIEMLNETQQRRPPYPLTWAEQAKLAPMLADHLQPLVLFALNTGARDNNVCGLRWSWEVKVPELKRSVFVIPAAEFKGQRDHVLILNDAAWNIVESCRGRHPDFVFVYAAPGHELGRIGTINNTSWQKSRAAAGLARVRVHDLRHTYGQRLRDAGVSEEDRALLLGHALAGMPQHYATATVARLVDIANKVALTVDRTTLLRVVNG
jgi:integrase